MSIVFFKPKHPAGICYSPYTPELLQRNSDLLFIFGDNISRTGSKGQAIIRNEPNAFGLVTKRKPSTTPDSYMTGTDLDLSAIKEDFNLLHQAIKAGRTVIFPASGLGTGLAQLSTRAPDLLNYIDTEVSLLIGTDYKLIRANLR